MKPILTEDGSHTFFIPELDEYYHSIYGAFQESETVFINAGLQAIKKEKIQLFEMGFGTGLNAFLTYLHTKNTNKEIAYYGVEAHPIQPKDARLLNYAQKRGDTTDSEVFNRIHACPWDQLVDITNHFHLNKLHSTIQNLNFANFPKFDLVYYDAFAPSAQSELWEEAIFKKLYEAMNQDALLVTYCAKGVVKRTLKSIGFKVEGLPGPKGKREMTRAIKI